MSSKMKTLIKFQKGELEGVVVYKKLEKRAPNEKIAKNFRQFASDEGRHAAVMHSYTNTTVKPGKIKSTLIIPLQKIIGWKLLLKIIAGQEYKGYDNYEPYVEDFPEIGSVREDEKRHGDMVLECVKLVRESYNFYGWQSADVVPVNSKYASIKNPRELYDLLMKVWCAETCAPRMRDNWNNSHPTYGQCSITAFLVQDIFGGEVYGILREGGNYHCYNVIGDCIFDLTSEQFGNEKLCYENNPVQSRDVHFAKEEKKLRYEYLKSKLDELIK